VPADTPDVEAAAAAAIAVITDRFDTGAVADLDVTVTAAEGTLTVDVYIDVPDAAQSEIAAAADAAAEAAMAATDSGG
jgi:hypothetical protein